MAVNINNFTAGTNVAKFDFAAEGVVDNNELKALLESQKDKYSVVSVENGKLVLYVNPRRRDNFLVAFFKKYFVGDANDREIYRQEERLLDNADKLAKNASFQQKIRLVENLRQKEGEIHSYESTQALAQLDKTLNTYLAEKQGTVKVNNLNELARGTNDVVQELAEACKACQLCNHYDNTVLISDKANCLVNIFEFITQHINIREYDPQGRIFKEDGQVDEEFLPSGTVDSSEHRAR